MKPNWDKLGADFNYKGNSFIADVDCTADSSKRLCEKHGVQGYPTVKCYHPDNPFGEDYEGGRDLSSLMKFVRKMSKKPCIVETLESCDEKEKEYLDEIENMTIEELKANLTEKKGVIDQVRADHQEAIDLLDKQNEAADANHKKTEDLKKRLKKLKNKLTYKLRLIKAMLPPEARDELKQSKTQPMAEAAAPRKQTESSCSGEQCTAL